MDPPRQRLRLFQEGTQTSEVTLENQNSHILFRDKVSKRVTFGSWDQGECLYILDCGGEGFDYLSDKCLVKRDLRTMDDVLDEIENIFTLGTKGNDKHPLSNRVLSTLVVDNISVYFWELKLLGLDRSQQRQLGYRRDIPGWQYYAELFRVIRRTQDRYNCNVIITSWDILYEKGVRFRGSIEAGSSKLQELTSLPSQYLVSFDYLYHRHWEKKRIDTNLYNRGIAQWIKV